jgi:hypothetical protein
MSSHIAKQRFMPNYLVWHQHGEVQVLEIDESDGNDDEDRMDDITVDIAMKYDLGSGDQHPMSKVQNFYMFFAASGEKLHDDTDLIILQVVTCLMVMKLMYNFSNQCCNDIIKFIIDLIPMKHNMSKDLYHSKKIVVGLSINYEKIGMCEKNYMLFWKEHKDDTECMHCGWSRYVKVVNKDGASVTTKVAVKQLRYMPITPWLKQLYLSEETTKQMRWHKEGKRDSEDSNIMLHPTNGEAWQFLDHFDLEFTRAPRSVCLGLSMDGFQPHHTDSSMYSCWPVFIMPYNLPPNKCLKQGSDQFMII